MEKERCSGGETIGHGEPTAVAGALFSGGSLSETEGINRSVRQLNRTVMGCRVGRTRVWRLQRGGLGWIYFAAVSPPLPCQPWQLKCKIKGQSTTGGI